jgi:hypothetical protein
MTAINLDTQIVATSYDQLNRTCSYTYQHSDGSRYTVTIPIDDLNKFKPNKFNARNFVGKAILNHIQTNPPDAAG